MSLQTLRHGETPTRKTDAWGTPLSVRRGVLRQWYPLIEGARQVETTGKRPGHPSKLGPIPASWGYGGGAYLTFSSAANCLKKK